MPRLPLDPRASIVYARRRVVRSSDEAAARLAKLVRQVPDARLEQLMRTPARRAVIETIFWLMPQHLDRSAAIGVTTAVRWRITTPGNRDPDVYTLVVAERKAEVVRGAAGPPPRVTITLDACEMLRLATGNSSPMQAYFNGKLALAGDVMQAAKLMALLHIPGTPPPSRTPAPKRR
jgi:SCP-2 sterol transfer family protein